MWWYQWFQDIEGSAIPIERAPLTSETDDTVNRKSGNVLESDVAGDDGDRVNHSIAMLPVVAGVRSEVTEANTS